MSIQNIKVGDNVPIELQIADGATDQYPRALVYDQGSLILTTIDLVHDNQGNYSGSVYAMPDNEFIKVIYIVYSDAGYTTVNAKYERDLEIFYKTNPMTDDAMVEMAQGDLPVAPSKSLALNYLYRKLRNKTFSTLILDRVLADDDVTELFKATLSDNAGVFTKEKYVSGA